MDIKPRAEVKLIEENCWLDSYYNVYVSFVSNPVFSIRGQMDHVDRRFNLDRTTPKCIYQGTLN